MKKLDNIDQLDALFKSKLDKAQINAPSDVWTQVSSSIGGGSTSVVSQLTNYFSSITNIVKVALFAGGIATVSVLLYQANSNEEKLSSDNPKEIVEQSVTPLDQDQTESTTTENIQDVDAGDSERIDGSEINNTTTEINTTPGTDATVGSDVGQGSTTSEDPVGTTTSETAEVKLTINSISNTACPGETRTFVCNNHQAGDWYINGKLVKSGSDVMSHRFTASGDYVVVCVQDELKAHFQLNVIQMEAVIAAKELINGQYEIAINSGHLEVKRWLINGKPVSDKDVLYHKLQPGKTHVAAELTDGVCNILAEKLINVEAKSNLYVPTIFTPNGADGNDSFFIDIKNYTSFNMQIFDRSGNRVFETNDPNIKWTGKVLNQGSDCPTGVYAVIIKYKLIGQDIKTMNEKLTLRRE